MSATYLIGGRQAQERKSDTLCSCGHRIGDHYELPFTDPSYKPLEFHCDHDNCIIKR